MIEDLKEKYFQLDRAQLIGLAVLLILIECSVFYAFVILPQLKARTHMKMEIDKWQKLVILQEDQLGRNRRPGVIGTVLEPETLEMLKENGNEIPSAAQMTEFLQFLEDVVGKTGGKKVEIEEGDSEISHIKIGPRDEVYQVTKMPVLLSFNASYGGVSNFLFQVRQMKRMMEISKVALHCDDYRGIIKVKVDLNIYYTEES